MSSGNPETRKRILDAAWHLLEKRRGQEVRLDDIAKAAKVSRQAVYLHFGSRAELLVATVRHVDEVLGLEQRLKKISEATTRSGADVLDALVEFWGNYIPEVYGLAKALLAVYDTDRDAAAAWDDRMAALQQGCRQAIGCLIRDQALAPGWNPDEASQLMWSLLSIAVWENLTVQRGWSTAQYIRQMQKVMRRAFVKAK